MLKTTFKEIDFCLYSFVNQSGRKSEGLLLRAKINDCTGFACVHSWPHLGDPTLDELLQELKDKSFKHPLLARAAENLNVDAAARKQNKPLLGNIHLKSHLQVNFETDLSLESIESFKACGFKSLKIKISKDHASAVENLKRLERHLGDLKLRLDFNSQLSATTFKSFLKSLGQNLLDSIDFMEDPFPLDIEWEEIQKEFKIRLAVDFEKHKARNSRLLECFDVLVLKPSCDDLPNWIDFAHHNMKRVVFTSYMQHPLGQAFDLLWAQKYFTEHPLLCDDVGFLNCEVQPFNNAYSLYDSQNSMIHIQLQTKGIGFDEALAKETWQKLW